MRPRNVRIDDESWNAALVRAEREGETLSSLIRGWLVDYAAGRKRVGPRVPDTVELSRAELSRLRDLIDGLLK